MQGQPAGNSINEYDFSVLDEIQPKGFKFTEVFREVVFYALPLFSFAFFITILFTSVLPTIQAINDGVGEISDLNNQVTALDNRITTIKALGEKNDEIQGVIDKINSIVPTGRTEVVKFGDRILTIVSKNSLLNSTLKTGESVLVKSDGTTKNSADVADADPTITLPLSEIPTEFNVQGKFNDIRSFFIDLYDGNDFFVVDKMDLYSDDLGEWYGDVSLVKYQFSPNDAFDPKKAYLSISENSQINADVTKFLEKKFINNAFKGSVSNTDNN